MSVPPNDLPKLAVPPVAAPVEGPLEIVPDEAQVFAVATPPPAASSKTAGWYVGRGGRREGPFDLAELRRQVQAGELKEADLLWREGMPAWTAAREVGEVFGASAPIAPPAPAMATAPVFAPTAAQVAPVASAPDVAPSPAPPSAPAPRKPALKAAELLAPVEQLLARPAFYRLAGYVAGVLGVLALLLSFVLFFWSATWLCTAALSLIVLFFVCEAAAAILDALQRGAGNPGRDKQR